jgi:hypothetical protein
VSAQPRVHQARRSGVQRQGLPFMLTCGSLSFAGGPPKCRWASTASSRELFMAASSVAKVGEDALLRGCLGGVRGVGELQDALAWSVGSWRSAGAMAPI